MVNAYTYLTPYQIPRDYMGATWQGWYSVYSQNRDSDPLERSNYRRILEDLKALDTELAESAIDPRAEDSPGDSTVTDTRVSHWACGWAEVIYVHSSNEAACKLADSILDKLADYPVYDESDFSAVENEECEQVWSDCYDAKERADYLRKHIGRIYPLSGYSNYSMLRQAVKGSWYHAANLLPCPSDLLA